MCVSHNDFCHGNTTVHSIVELQIAHETTVCRGPPIQSFAEESKKLDESPADLHVSMLQFYENVRTNNFLVGTTFWQKVSFVTELPRNPGISDWQIVWVMTSHHFMSDMSLLTAVYMPLLILTLSRLNLYYIQWRTEGGGGVFKHTHTPPPEIPKALQNRAKLNPIVKTVKNCWI